MKVFDTSTMEGGFRVLGKTKRSEAATMVLDASESTGGADNKHKNSDQWLYVVSGSGKALVEGCQQSLRGGTLLLIEAGETHEIISSDDAPLRTLSFYAPPAY